MMPEHTAALLRGRRTIHLFKPEVPPRSVVLQALDAARWAPNHRLTEPWRFYLLGPETAAAVAHLNAEIVAEKRGPAAAENKRARWLSMPGWLVLTCRRSDDPLRMREDYGACCCAAQNMMLALWAAGVGTKWGTGKVTRDDRFFELLGIDRAEEQVVGLFWYGYPAEVPAARRKPLTDVLEERP